MITFSFVVFKLVFCILLSSSHPSEKKIFLYTSLVKNRGRYSSNIDSPILLIEWKISEIWILPFLVCKEQADKFISPVSGPPRRISQFRNLLFTHSSSWCELQSRSMNPLLWPFWPMFDYRPFIISLDRVPINCYGLTALFNRNNSLKIAWSRACSNVCFR